MMLNLRYHICTLFLLLLAQSVAAMPAGIQISDLKDVHFGSVGSDQINTETLPVCVVATGPPFYNITIQGTAIGNNFVLQGMNNATIRLILEWSDNPKRSSGKVLKPGVAEGSFIASPVQCGDLGNNNARRAYLILSVLPADLVSAPAGFYSTALTLTVSRV